MNNNVSTKVGMKDLVKMQILESIATKKLVLEDESIHSQIVDLASSCLNALRSDGKVIFAGNGGSFADAQHLSAEFTSRFLFDRGPLASIALSTNSSSMSAIGNDYGYTQVFSRELEAIGRKEDVFIAISTSGNSENIITAVHTALKLSIKTFVMTGKTGGKLKEICECICIPSFDTARIQESHILVGHVLCGLVESFYFQNKNISS